MPRIRSLRANVTREEAMQQFSSGMFDFLRENYVWSVAFGGRLLHSVPALPD